MGMISLCLILLSFKWQCLFCVFLLVSVVNFSIFFTPVAYFSAVADVASVSDVSDVYFHLFYLFSGFVVFLRGFFLCLLLSSLPVFAVFWRRVVFLFLLLFCLPLIFYVL